MTNYDKVREPNRTVTETCDCDTGLDVRYVSTVSGPRADTELYPLYLDRDTVIQYVLYLIVSGLEADTDWIHCIIQQIHCIVHVGR